jgi:hypothetical protein
MKYLILLSTILIVGSVLAHPTVSNELQEILIQQSEKVKSGHNDITAYRAELEKLADTDDIVAKFLFSTISLGDNWRNKKVVKYLHDSASQGCAGSAGILAIKYLSESKIKVGIMWLKYAAENGDAVSQTALGQYYISGEMGLKKDTTEGLAWKRLAIEQSYSKGLSSQLKLFEIQNGEALNSQAVEVRFRQLLEEIGIQPFYACGQSVP